jgi:PAS domain S-box-containing protein
MIDAVPDALMLVDLHTRVVVAANSAASSLIGLASNDLIGKQMADIEPLPVDQCYWEEIDLGPFRSLQAVETEYQRADGSWLPVRKSTAQVDGGQSGSILVLVHDLRRENTVQSYLERVNAELASIFEATSEGLLVIDAERHLARINHRLSEIWSLPEELISSMAGDSILNWISRQSTTPSETRLELFSHFKTMESRVNGSFCTNNGSNIHWYANPQILDGDIIGHVFGFVAPWPTGKFESDGNIPIH